MISRHAHAMEHLPCPNPWAPIVPDRAPKMQEKDVSRLSTIVFRAYGLKKIGNHSKEVVFINVQDRAEAQVLPVNRQARPVSTVWVDRRHRAVHPAKKPAAVVYRTDRPAAQKWRDTWFCFPSRRPNRSPPHEAIWVWRFFREIPGRSHPEPHHTRLPDPGPVRRKAQRPSTPNGAPSRLQVRNRRPRASETASPMWDGE